MSGKNALSILILTLLSTMLLFSTGCGEKVPLTVTNGLEDYNIFCIYISRGTDDIWGSNHLPGTDILEPGKTAEVMVRAGVYDLQVVDEDGDTYTLNDIRVNSDGFNWTVTIDMIDNAENTAGSAVPNAGECPLTVTNDLGSWELNGIWISSSSSDSWGENYLNGEILCPGDTYTAYLQPDTYDIYLQDEDTDTYTRYSVIVGSNGYIWNVTLDDLDSSGG